MADLTKSAVAEPRRTEPEPAPAWPEDTAPLPEPTEPATATSVTATETTAAVTATATATATEPDAPATESGTPTPEPAPPATEPGPAAPGARKSALVRRRRAVLAVAASATLLSVGGLGGAMLVKSPAQAAADTRAPRASVITATVASERLARTAVLRGDVTSGATLSITPTSVADTRALGGGTNPGGMAPVLTRKLAHVGDTVAAARPLVEFSGRPVYVLPGSIPVYRDILPGESGQDIAQLQSALAGLGLYDGGDKRGFFGPATGKAVTALYHRMGYPVPVTGGQEGGQSGQAGESGQNGEPAGGGGSTSGPFVPASEMAFVSSVPVRVISLPASVGDKVNGPAVTLATGGLKLTGYLDPSFHGLVKDGMKVRITSESLGLTASGTVASVGALVTPGDKSGAQSSDGAAPGQGAGGLANGGVPYLPMQITRTGSWDNRLDGQNVRITLTAAATTGAVLTVPEAAINAGANARTSVTVVGSDGSQRKVHVTVGVSADGRVQVTPDGTARLRAGDRVVVGQ
ncbi:peptidoglycan-binding protein [Streptomyces sp. NBC_00820]|uniref:peptidoglycan-binding domain-containing protein n=1 Tax=Streptomyces sp. NBC_00820 TaxID=2975842 RepID=UPI002ED2A6AE|nr:peptidoglycan-binding protein [Streptomyces sp. NBC_00820]